MTNGRSILVFCPPDSNVKSFSLGQSLVRTVNHWGISVDCSDLLSSMKCSISFHRGKRDVYV